ncbi:heat stress transcription factor A-1-like [Dendrobium catenatum]|uniref:Heat stress transcription factor A-1 n=1 Tax=Dendrobium catenatum TaxID=906689 RepID=A0A2I0VY34_9ASPA|nr:heat stress transcription factor A-1-like [Dendrobium catenatum]PKU68328.1 Heat stress transcription factor A-1 [Dendrobium catenatum]
MEPEKPNGSTGGGGVPHPSTFPPFLTKCYDMVNDPATDDTVCWGDSENTFIIKDQHTFSRDLLPKYFKHSNISSFIRQLNTYGFRKVDHDKWVFKNDGFVKGQKVLLKTITRKKSPYNNINPQQQIQGKPSSVKAVEVGQFGIEEEIERLKRDKNLLMQELVTVRQHQQNTDAELNDLRQRLQVMELNQQQMLSFLAMAVQSPTFLSQLVQQNINGRWRSEMNKKRRLPALEDGLGSSDKQIIKYEPSLMEAIELSSDPSKSSQSVCNGINDLCANVDHISIGEEDSCKSAEGENSIDFSEYLEKLLIDSPILENNGQTEPLYFDIPDFNFDFDFPVQDVEMEASPNTASSGEVLL